MNKDKIRNWLNLIFMIGAIVGVMYIILISMCFKIAESSLRMIK